MLLYEQCSEKSAEEMPSSTMLIGRPRAFTIASNSPGFRPCSRASSGVAVLIHGACEDFEPELLHSLWSWAADPGDFVIGAISVLLDAV